MEVEQGPQSPAEEASSDTAKIAELPNGLIGCVTTEDVVIRAAAAATAAHNENVDDNETPSEGERKEPAKPQSSLEEIRRKLSIAGLRDEAKLSTTQPLAKPKLSHRRSRSLGEVAFDTSISSVPVGGGALAKRGLKLSCANVKDQPGNCQGLEQMKKHLLNEVKIKLQERIDAKLECHKSEQKSVGEIAELPETEAPVSTNGHTVNDNEKLESRVDGENAGQVLEQVNPENNKPSSSSGTPAPISPAVEESSKRFSICSLSGAELRKRYSPVYERTRKLVRQGSSSGSGSINRWSSSQPQVVTPQQKNAPNSPSASVETQGTAPVLSPVASKGDLENEPQMEKPDSIKEPGSKSVDIDKTPLVNGEYSVPSSQQTVTMDSSTTKIGQYSAHPSVYVIEQEDRNRILNSSSGIGDSRSDKMDRSTSTLKRGASFKALKKNIKKTFSTQIPPLTLEKADKAPGIDTDVPAIVVCCVETMKRKGFLKTEGLYRSSPSQLEVRKVIKHARKGDYDYVKSVDDPVILAGTLKSFFFNLKYHIISGEVMEKNFPKNSLMGNLSEQEYLERLKGVISDLDTTHYDSLEYIIRHLQEVASYSKFNLMTPSNLGVVWAPCLFTNCDKSVNDADLLSFMGEQTRLLELLITHAEALFDRYMLDEIMIAIEDGYPADLLRDGEPTLNLQPNFDSMLGRPEDFERRKLLRNMSLTFDNVFAATNGHEELTGNGSAVRHHYELQNSSTVPAISSAHSDGTVTRQRIQKMKRSRSKAVCVVS